MASRTARVVLGGLPAEVGRTLRRHVVAAAVPALALGAAADIIALTFGHLAAEIAVGLFLVVLFELYVGYAELIVGADRDRHRARRPAMRLLLRRAVLLTPALVGASLAAVTIPLAAAGFLVIPGVWLLTRWSLFAPAVVHEGLSPIAALRRSSGLVRGAFWSVACTAAAALIVEETVVHASVHAGPALGLPLAGLVASALIVAVVSPPAAFTVSIVYERLAGQRGDAPAPSPSHSRPSAYGGPWKRSSRAPASGRGGVRRSAAS